MKPATDLDIVRIMAAKLKTADHEAYVCELGPDQTRHGGTTITIDGTFFFDRDGKIINDKDGPL
jgi:hypothetical protein